MMELKDYRDEPYRIHCPRYKRASYLNELCLVFDNSGENSKLCTITGAIVLPPDTFIVHGYSSPPIPKSLRRVFGPIDGLRDAGNFHIINYSHEIIIWFEDFHDAAKFYLHGF